MPKSPERQLLEEIAVLIGAAAFAPPRVRAAMIAAVRRRLEEEGYLAGPGRAAKPKRRPAHSWTREDDLRLLAGRRAGGPYAEMAGETGISVGQLQCRRYDLYSDSGRKAYREELERELSRAGREKAVAAGGSNSAGCESIK